MTSRILRFKGETYSPEFWQHATEPSATNADIWRHVAGVVIIAAIIALTWWGLRQ